MPSGFYENIPTPKPDANPSPFETVHHPAHYGGDTVYEVIKVITAWKLDFSLGNAVKYIARAGKKTANPLEDLKKARFYLDYEIKRLEELGRKKLDVTTHDGKSASVSIGRTE
jgi:hypothetical protein